MVDVGAGAEEAFTDASNSWGCAASEILRLRPWDLQQGVSKGADRSVKPSRSRGVPMRLLAFSRSAARVNTDARLAEGRVDGNIDHRAGSAWDRGPTQSAFRVSWMWMMQFGQ